MKTRGRAANGMLLFLIYGMFALFSLFIVVIGAKVYRDLAFSGSKNTEVRSAFSYVANKVRINGGEPNSIKTENINGINVLLITENYDNEKYKTLIYCCDGELREIFAPYDKEFNSESGDKITDVNNFKIKKYNNGLLITLTEKDGFEQSMYLGYPVSDKG